MRISQSCCVSFTSVPTTSFGNRNLAFRSILLHTETQTNRLTKPLNKRRMRYSSRIDALLPRAAGNEIWNMQRRQHAENQFFLHVPVDCRWDRLLREISIEQCRAESGMMMMMMEKDRMNNIEEQTQDTNRAQFVVRCVNASQRRQQVQRRCVGASSRKDSIIKRRSNNQWFRQSNHSQPINDSIECYEAKQWGGCCAHRAPSIWVACQCHRSTLLDASNIPAVRKTTTMHTIDGVLTNRWANCRATKSIRYCATLSAKIQNRKIVQSKRAFTHNTHTHTHKASPTMESGIDLMRFKESSSSRKPLVSTSIGNANLSREYASD